MAAELDDDLDSLRRVAYGRLLAVREVVDLDPPHNVRRVELELEAGTLTVAAVADDDTLSVVDGCLPLEEDERVLDLAATSIWHEAIGRSLRWAWLLTNHQGYRDGLQLELVGDDASEAGSVELQTMVIGSAIRLRRLVPA